MDVGWFILVFFSRTFFLKLFLLLETSFGNGEEKGALETILLAVLAEWRICVTQNVASDLSGTATVTSSLSLGALLGVDYRGCRGVLRCSVSRGTTFLVRVLLSGRAPAVTSV